MDANSEQMAFVYTTYVQETPERVWQGLTDPALMERYWRHQQAGPKTFHSDWKKGSLASSREPGERYQPARATLTAA
jgi:uncharacterized protein YndB with AHSA1/START domain